MQVYFMGAEEFYQAPKKNLNKNSRCDSQIRTQKPFFSGIEVDCKYASILYGRRGVLPGSIKSLFRYEHF